MSKVTVSGPGCDEKHESPELGLSLAINRASSAAKRREEATFYVRNADENVVGTAEAHSDGSVDVYGQMALVEASS